MIQTGKFIQSPLEGAVTPSLLSENVFGWFASYEDLRIFLDDFVKYAFVRNDDDALIIDVNFLGDAEIPKSPNGLKYGEL